MNLRKIDIDTLSISDGTTPDWGSITVLIDGRSATFRLDEAQIGRLASVGAEVAAEIVDEIAKREPVAA